MRHTIIILLLGLSGVYAQTLTPVTQGGSGAPALLDDITRITFDTSGTSMLLERIDGTDTVTLDSIRHILFDEDGTVPVELASFTADRTPDGIRLAWHTASEENNLGWYVLRGTAPDAAFERKNEQLIPGAGTSAQTHGYAFTDSETGTGTWHYRLQQVDTDGTCWYSWIVTVPATSGITDRTRPVPELQQNPARTFTFGITVTGADDIKLTIDRMDGTPVTGIFNGRLPAGRHRFTWPAADRSGRSVPAGTYLLRMRTGSGEATLTKLVVQ